MEIGTQVSDADAFIPDVSVVQASRSARRRKDLPRSPELAIEVVSPSDTAKHLKRKVDAYLASRIKIGLGRLSRSPVGDGSHLRIGSRIESRSAIHDPLLPGFSTPVAAFFELT